MRLLFCDGRIGSGLTRAVGLGAELDDGALAQVYAVPPDAARWVRVNMVTTLDGSATGSDGKSGTINTPADGVVFELLRALSDVVLVGAGTVRDEGYGPLRVAERWAPIRARLGLDEALPLVVVSNHGDVPDRLSGAEGAVFAAVPDELVSSLAGRFGSDHVIGCGAGRVDLGQLVDQLADLGWHRLHCEGGPSLLGSMAEAGVLDELCLTLAPRLVVGDGRRISSGVPQDLAMAPLALVEEAGTIMGRWSVTR